ncbi:MAG TPA: response regulator [Sandaracinaceae bacterium LLY-WYZ-13_1]|nr:response regulator [Sandaracinaceae bacterium LLY-WYZ-13_1]
MSRTSSGELTSRFSVSLGTAMGVAPAREGTPRLVVLMGPEAGRRFGLEGDSVLVGRSDECQVQLDDTKVSRRHARLARREDGSWSIEDLGSRNGTLVNGEVVDLHALRVGDRIQLSGETLLLFTRQDPLEEALLHRQQMEVIGQLAAGIAHDFNNLLNVITASTAHVEGLPPDTALGDDEVRECHADIAAAAKRAAELTARLLTIARRREQRASPTPSQEVDVSRLCDDVLKLVRRTFDRSISVVADVAPGLRVTGDQAALHQLLMNLCINARDAMPDGGCLRVHATCDAEPDPSSSSPWPMGPQVVVSVSDTGIGMDEPTRIRVFEPFFTTKEKGAGSGLGLATVYEVATSHGGNVEVESELGVGSTFRLRLPARQTEPEGRRRAKKRKISTWDGGHRASEGRVLVVDDQELVRRSLGRLLKAAGHEVTYASDGREALERYDAADPKPDVVLLDLDMPHLSGAETLERLRAADPDVRVVLISGYYDDARKKRLLDAGAAEFLSKPVDAEKLRTAIRVALQIQSVVF